MAKRKLTFREKLRVFRFWMRQEADYGLSTVCAICDSTRIKLFEPYTNKGGYVTHYSANYTCMDCGAEGIVNERWLTVNKEEAV